MRVDRKQAFVQRRGFDRWFNHADEQSARAPRRKSAAAQPRAGNTVRISAAGRIVPLGLSGLYHHHGRLWRQILRHHGGSAYRDDPDVLRRRYLWLLTRNGRAAGSPLGQGGGRRDPRGNPFYPRRSLRFARRYFLPSPLKFPEAAAACPWPSNALGLAYCDPERGGPPHDDHALFELLRHEDARAGLIASAGSTTPSSPAPATPLAPNSDNPVPDALAACANKNLLHRALCAF